MPRTFFRSLRHALRGLRTVGREERNFRIHLLMAMTALAVTITLRFTLLEIAAVILAILLVLGSEIMNTVVEQMMDVLEPRHHPGVGKIKDTAAGLVLLMSLGAAIIGGLVLRNHFIS